ncbi:conserved hypothetical protein [Thiomonas sp. X19]|uniref:AbrB/MazE/SpoVT family DNA-binding domain-containing protein n=1 Tax=Thiomonas sp. X19 TaxID=1050370 RepID=UPI000B66C7B1|nr:AbrB/MazE/SpoVT family DNA-binding domain-containing protein [Thiomonas sp. X19]SCC95531.1 conserved hypothetical protein [Thiomonas sp. X19]
MPTATLTSKGQITLPLAVRKALGVSTGQQVDFVPDKDGFRVVAVSHDVATLKGRFAGRVGKPVSLEAMDEAIAAGAAARARKSA